MIDIRDVEKVENIKPHFDWCLIKVIKKGESAGGIIIPEIAMDDMPKCLIIAVGEGSPLPDGRFRPVPFKPGDICLCIGTLITILGDEYAFCRETQLLATLGSDKVN